MNATDTLRNLAAIAASRAETYKPGDEARTDLQWFASKAESLANAIDRGVISAERFEIEITNLDEIGAMPAQSGQLSL